MRTGPDSSDALMSGATVPSLMISLAIAAHRRAALSQSPVWSSLMQRTLSRSRTA